uniref:Plastid lipid-associated protein/fibrillin conserved domain-containing protein n=1 Tax=Aureoumbra lagunensis TaxID=44058 RepID=A0A7S3K2Z3_9STRA|mmetsp:Transcript_10946/g.16455  ORF Transcript_10946/g.16455 Transcript_10946/m.16455 type:complete len:191 (+) Transcript_10946:145-717(+)
MLLVCLCCCFMPSLALSIALQKSKELYTILSSEERNKVKIDQLIDEIIAEEKPIDIRNLGQGLWYSKYFRGSRPKWAPRQGSKNVAGQSYDIEEKSVENYAEIFGDKVYFLARGTFQPRTNSVSWPLDVDVMINNGGLIFFGFFLNFGIEGPGIQRILYCDQFIRIFQAVSDSPDLWEQQGLLVVQCRPV